MDSGLLRQQVLSASTHLLGLTYYFFYIDIKA